MKIKLGSKELVPTSASVMRTITGISEFNCVIEWSPGKDKELDELIRPHSFANVEISILGEKIFTGYLYSRTPILSLSGNALTLGGFSKVYGLVMSNPRVQKEFLESSLLDISNEFCNIFGINVVSDGVDNEINEKFENEKIGAQDKIFAFLQNLARQRAILTSDDADGNLLYLIANTKKNSVGSIIEGKGAIVPMTDQFSANFDDTDVYQTYVAVNDSPYSWLLKDAPAISKDMRIKVPSFKTIVINSLEEGAGQKAVDLAHNQTIVKSLSMPMHAFTWKAPNGKLWRENTIVTVESPTLFIPDGYSFLISKVQYNLDSSGGETTDLIIAPPSLYSAGEVSEPWE